MDVCLLDMFVCTCWLNSVVVLLHLTRIFERQSVVEAFRSNVITGAPDSSSSENETLQIHL